MEEETTYVTKTSPRGDKSIEKGRKWNPLKKNTDFWKKCDWSGHGQALIKEQMADEIHTQQAA